MISIGFSCSKENDIDKFVERTWDECSAKENCIIDFDTFIDFDTMFYFGHLSLEKMSTILKTDMIDYEDLGEYIVFVKEDEIVYSKGWFKSPERKGKGMYIVRDTNVLKYCSSDAKFRITKYGELFSLTQINKYK